MAPHCQFVSLWSATLCLSNSLGCLEISMGSLWLTTQLNVTHPCYWKPHLAPRDGALRLCVPHYWKCSSGSPSWIPGSFLCIRFPHHPSQSTPISVISAHTLSLYLVSSLHLIPPDTCPQFAHKSYSISPYQGDPCNPPSHFSLPNFSGSTDCRLVMYLFND